MRRSFLIFAILLMLCGCAQRTNVGVEEEMQQYSFEGTVFEYGGQKYDLAEREESVNSILAATQAGKYIVVEGHIGPKAGMYYIFDTEQKGFVRDLAGCNLIWRDDDIHTAIYSIWSDICDYNGNVIKTMDLKESEFIYELRFAEEIGVLEVEIATELDFRVEQIVMNGGGSG